MVNDWCQGESWEQFSPQFVCKLVKFLPVYELLWLEPSQEHKVQADFFTRRTKGGVSGISGGDDYLSASLPPPPPTPTLSGKKDLMCFCPVRAALPACKQVGGKKAFPGSGGARGRSQESCFRFIENCCFLAEHDVCTQNKCPLLIFATAPPASPASPFKNNSPHKGPHC